MLNSDNEERVKKLTIFDAATGDLELFQTIDTHGLDPHM